MGDRRVRTKNPLANEFLKDLRNKRGLTQEQVCNIMGPHGVTTRTLSSIENGRHFPDACTIFLLAAVYKVEPHEILESYGLGITEEIERIKSIRGLLRESS